MSNFGCMLSCMFYIFKIHSLDKVNMHLLYFFLCARKISFAICESSAVIFGYVLLAFARSSSRMMYAKVSFLVLFHIQIN